MAVRAERLRRRRGGWRHHVRRPGGRIHGRPRDRSATSGAALAVGHRGTAFAGRVTLAVPAAHGSGSLHALAVGHRGIAFAHPCALPGSFRVSAPPERDAHAVPVTCLLILALGRSQDADRGVQESAVPVLFGGAMNPAAPHLIG